MRRRGHGNNAKPRSVDDPRAAQPQPEPEAPTRLSESPANIDIRVPVVFRCFYWANTVVAIGVIPYFVVTDGMNDSLLVFLLFGVICAVQFGQLAALRVQSDGEVLVVRNPWRTHRVRAKEIQRFVAARERTWFNHWPGMLVIVCELKRGGSIDLWATRTVGFRRYDAASEPLALTIEELLAWKRSAPHETHHTRWPV